MALRAVLCAIAFLAFLTPIDNADVWFHLRLGSEIVESGRVPRDDRHSFTADGAPFVAQEWLTEVGLYGLLMAAGTTGIALASAALVAATFGVLLAAMEGPIALRALLLLAAAPVISTHAMARPHVLGWLLLALLQLFLRRGWRWRLVPFMALWANCHASFALGAGLVVLHVAEEALAARDPRKLRPGAAAAAATLLTPYGHHLWLFFRDLGDLPLDTLGEFKAYEPGNRWFWCWTGWVALLAAGLLRRLHRNPFDWLRAGLLCGMSYASMRYAPVTCIALSPLLSTLWKPDAGRLSPRALSGAGWAAVALALAGLGGRVRERQACRLGVDRERLPVAATGFLLESPVRGPIFNAYEFGGYLLWYAWPEFRVFVDGRMDVYRGKPIQDYYRVVSAVPEWPELLASYRVRCVMVQPERILAKALYESTDWELVFFDNTAVIFVAKGDWPELRRLPLAQGDMARHYAGRGAESARADRERNAERVAEMEHLLGLNPRFFTAHKRLAILHLRRGLAAREAGLAREADEALRQARLSLGRYLALRPEGQDDPEGQELLSRLGMPQ